MSKRIEGLPVYPVPIKASYPSILTDVRAVTESHKPHEAWQQLASIFEKNDTRVDLNEKIEIHKDPVPLYNVSSYLACKFWIENVKTQRNPCIFELKVDNTVISLTSMRGSTSEEGEVDGYTVDQMIHAGILGLNQMVSYSLKADRKLLMTPLARVCATDANVEEIGRLAQEYCDIEGKPMAIGAKVLNVNTARKSWQFSGSTKYYWPELSIACLIRTIIGPKSDNQTDLIGKKHVRKITNQGVVNPKQITDLIACLNIPGSMNNEVEEIVSMWKAGKNKTFFGRLEKRGTTTRMLRTARSDETEDMIIGEDLATGGPESLIEAEDLSVAERPRSASSASASRSVSATSSVAEFTDAMGTDSKKDKGRSRRQH